MSFGTIKSEDKNLTFDFMIGVDGEVYGVLTDHENKKLESGFYRTEDPEQAARIAFLNHS